jgi:hypothetical protein
MPKGLYYRPRSVNTDLLGNPDLYLVQKHEYHSSRRPRGEFRFQLNLRVLVIILKIVQAGGAAWVSQPSIGKYMLWVIKDKLLRVDMLQEPGERFALVLLLKKHSVLNTP